MVKADKKTSTSSLEQGLISVLETGFDKN